MLSPFPADKLFAQGLTIVPSLTTQCITDFLTSMDNSATKLKLVIYEVYFADDKIKDVEVGRMVSEVSSLSVDASNGRIS